MRGRPHRRPSPGRAWPYPFTVPRVCNMSATAFVPETFPRRWLPAGVELMTGEQIEPWYRRLLDPPIGSPEELERWLFDVGELNAAVGQEGVTRYIAMTCQPD